MAAPGWGVAVREGAAAVTRGQRESLGLAEQAAGAAVGGDAVDGVEDDGHEAVVAAGPGQGVAGGDEGAVAGAGQALTGAVGVLGHGDDQGGGDAGDRGQLLAAHGELQRVEQGVVAALAGGARVFDPVVLGFRGGEGVDDGLQVFGQFGGGLELAVC